MSNPTLEQAIEQFHIPPWPYEAVFDRVVVFSVPERKALRDTYTEEGTIIMPNSRREKEENESPRAVLVSAGLGARDVLRSHGMGLGHVVWVARLSPWRHEVDRDSDGRPIQFMFLRVGDIVGSETLQDMVKLGHVTVDLAGDGSHRYVFHGAAIPRFDPPSYVA